MARWMVTWSVVVGLLALVTPVAAQVRYVDRDGAVHWVQSADQIPPEYRGQTQPTLSGAGATPDPRRKAFENEALRLNERARREQESQEVQARRQQEFRQAATLCERRTGVQINVKPGQTVNILGTTQERFNFDKCMTDSGQSLR